MRDDLRAQYVGRELPETHEKRDAAVATFRYVKPNTAVEAKGFVPLAKGELLRTGVQIVRSKEGENKLHYHTNVETFWWVVKGRARFYGPGDVLLGDFGPGEGMITPRYSRYWFENRENDDLELLQLAASDLTGTFSGRTDTAPLLQWMIGRTPVKEPEKPLSGPGELGAQYAGCDLPELHEKAEKLFATYRYAKPAAKIERKGHFGLARGELIRGSVQVLKPNKDANNLHYHTNVETFWWVIIGRCRFYGPEDVLLGDFGPGEGIITPRYSRYWFENKETDDLELLQVAASDVPGLKSGRTDAAPRRRRNHSTTPPT